MLKQKPLVAAPSSKPPGAFPVALYNSQNRQTPPTRSTLPSIVNTNKINSIGYIVGEKQNAAQQELKKHHDEIKEVQERNIRIIRYQTMNILYFYLYDLFNILCVKSPTITVDILVQKDVPIQDAYKYGLDSWQKMIECGLKRKHMTRDRWFNVCYLTDRMRINIKVLNETLTFSIIDLIEQHVSPAEMHKLGCSMDVLFELGLNFDLFYMFDYTLKQWKEDMRVTATHLTRLGFTKEVFFYMATQKKWPAHEILKYYGINIIDMTVIKKKNLNIPFRN